jgi:hypothetical protein
VHEHQKKTLIVTTCPKNFIVNFHTLLFEVVIVKCKITDSFRDQLKSMAGMKVKPTIQQVILDDENVVELVSNPRIPTLVV